jgi:hypothetical protein
MTKYELSETGQYYYRTYGQIRMSLVQVKYNRFYEELEVWFNGADEGILLSKLPSDSIFEEVE